MGREQSDQVLCPVLVGRDVEWSALRQLLERARGGRGSVASLAGEAGIGKTRLAREAAVLAEQTEMVVLMGRSSTSQSPMPYRALAEALVPALRRDDFDAPELEVVRPILERILHESSAREAEPSVPLVHDAVLRALAAMARARGGLLLILEDIQWADGDSLGVLDYLADHISAEPVACVVTLRDDPGQALDLVEAMAARRTLSLFTLARLADNEIAEMARASLDTIDVSPSLLAALESRAEGVPFVVEEMLTQYVASGGTDTSPNALPHTYRELVRARLDTLDASARQVLQAAAIVGTRFDWSLLAGITSIDREGVLDSLRIAGRQKLIESRPASGFEMPFAFRHLLVREAILGEMLPPELEELASRAADTIEELFVGLPGDWCERVADLREAAGDKAAAARHLQEAGRRSLVRGAIASAETALERARRLVYGDRWHRIGIDRQLVDVLSAAGKVDRLREIASDAVEWVRQKHQAMPFVILGLGDLHLRLARCLSAAGDHAAAEEDLRQAREIAAETSDEELVARIRAFEASRALESGDAAAALEMADAAAATARRSGLRETLVEALRVQGAAAFALGDSDGAIGSLQAACDEAGVDVVARIPALLELCRLKVAIQGDATGLEDVRVLGESVGAVSVAASAGALIAEAATARFELDGGLAELSDAIEAARRYELPLLQELLATQAERQALQPGDDDAERALEGLASPARAHLVLALRLEDRQRVHRSVAELPGDHIARAVGCLLSVLDGDEYSSFPTANSLAVGLLAFTEVLSQSTADGVVDRSKAADEMLTGSPWWRHMARRLAGEKMIEGDGTEGVTFIRESLIFFEEAGHERSASACRALLRGAGVAVPRRGRGDSTVPASLRNRGVSSREMDVLRLVALGLGNVEIARRLFLSRRTVESHVASLMRKLDARTRAALARAAESPAETD